MNLKSLTALLLLAAFLVSACKKKDKPDDSAHAVQEKIQAILDNSLREQLQLMGNKPVGMALFIRGEKENIFASAGFPEGYGEHVHFRGASTTKTFTAAAILKLHQEGKLNIDDHITASIPGTATPYIPDEPSYNVPFKDAITIRMLLAHRAGIFDVSNDNIPDTVSAPYAGLRYADYVLDHQGSDHTFTFKELIGVVAEHQLYYFAPGASFHYSNTGYNVLATIVERVSGQSFQAYLTQNFVQPLNLTETTFPYLGTDQSLPAPYVTGWLKMNNDFIEFDQDNVSIAPSEGNIITTPRDLAEWAYILYGTETILKAPIQQEMIQGALTNDHHIRYGLGCATEPADIGYGHDGARPAYMTVMRYHPPTKRSYVLVFNFLNVDDMDREGADMNEIIRKCIQAIEK